MYERYIIVSDTWRRIDSHGSVPCGAVDLRLAYYRGIALSLVEGIELTIDGMAVDAEQMHLTVGGTNVALQDLAHRPDLRWEFSEAATLVFACPAELSHGPHEICVTELLRIAYVPGTTRRHDCKTMILAG